MQHDVFAHPLRRVRAAYPFIAVLQSDYSPGEQRLCAPLVPRSQPSEIRGVPIVLLSGRYYALNLMEMFAVPARLLRQQRIGSVASNRDEILRGLDWLFTGI